MREELDEQVAQVLAAWAHEGLVDESASDQVATRQARVAVLTTMGLPVECGAEHPDRRSIRCTYPPDHASPVHRNPVLRLEWWVEGGRTWTYSDGVGPVELVPPGKYRPLGHDGTCGPAENEEPTADGEWWAPGDTIPLHVDRVETSTKFVWARVRGREGQDLRYFELVACPVLLGEDVLAIFGPVTQVDDEPGTDPDVDSPEVLVYRALIPILDRAGEKLRRLQRSYKGAATRGVEQAARDCERAVQQLEKLVDPDPGGDPDA